MLRYVKARTEQYPLLWVWYKLKITACIRSDRQVAIRRAYHHTRVLDLGRISMSVYFSFTQAQPLRVPQIERKRRM